MLKKRLLAFLFLFFLLTGCASAAKKRVEIMIPKPIIKTPRDYGQWSDKNLVIVGKFLGQSKGALKSQIGEPSYIRQNVIFKGKIYEEQFGYYYSRGIPLLSETSWSCIFYINDGIVENVDVL